jgi:hypothetical protein
MIPDKEIIDNHKQLAPYSCIPMAVELVLKLLGRAQSNYFELQTLWNNFRLGSFCNFDGRTVNGVTFRHQFPVTNGRDFPPEKMKQLFDTIDSELREGRYAVVSLPRRDDYHNFVIYDQTADGEYEAVSKNACQTCWKSGVKNIITHMTGTDILTYEL